MPNDVVLSAAHWVYLIGVLVIIITMLFRANVVVPSVIGTLAVVTAITGSPIQGIISIFSASFVAAKELFNIFLVITFMTALLNSLKRLEADVRMVAPFRKVMVNSTASFLMIGAATYFISLFFWPTPAVPLVSAILLPAAIAAGLPPLVGAMVIAICGQGMALSSDYIIGVAPGISAKAAGVAADVGLIADRALVLSWITGGVALTLAFLFMRRYFKPADTKLLDEWMGQAPDSTLEEVESQGTYDKAEIARGTAGSELTAHGSLSSKEQRYSRILAVITPLAFLAVIGLMLLPRFIPSLPVLRGGEAAGLVGGVAFILMTIATCMAEGPRRTLDVCPDHMTDGFVFAFRAMGSVLPIAGFFFLGASEAASAILDWPMDKTPSLLFELISAGQQYIPENHFLVAFGVLLVGVVSGIDGSGFSGLPLTGTLASALAPVSGLSVETLAAVGQIGAIWTGGGTLIAWSSLIAVAGFARVHVLDLVRALTVPVLVGMAVSTACAVLFF